MQPELTRLAPDVPFPPYTFVPGKAPHPVSDPAGHSFGHTPEPVEPLTADNWRQNRAYLFAIDLFNAGFYWEAHEAWESLWHAAGRKGTTADFLKGLIHLAAAGVKHLEGRPKGVQSHARRAAELIRGVAETVSGVHLGFRPGDLAQVAETIAREGWPDAAPLLMPELGS
jgi:predicted metal-dependent hydrolase